MALTPEEQKELDDLIAQEGGAAHAAAPAGAGGAAPLEDMLDPSFDLAPQALAVQPSTTDPKGDDDAAASFLRKPEEASKGTIYVYEPPLNVVQKRLAEDPQFAAALSPSLPPDPARIANMTREDSLYQMAADQMCTVVQHLERLAGEQLPLTGHPHQRVVAGGDTVAPRLDRGARLPRIQRVRLGIELLRCLGGDDRPSVLSPDNQIPSAGTQHVPDGRRYLHREPIVAGDPPSRRRRLGLVVGTNPDAAKDDAISVRPAGDATEVRARLLLERDPGGAGVLAHLGQRSVSVGV